MSTARDTDDAPTVPESERDLEYEATLEREIEELKALGDADSTDVTHGLVDQQTAYDMRGRRRGLLRRERHVRPIRRIRELEQQVEDLRLQVRDLKRRVPDEG